MGVPSGGQYGALASPKNLFSKALSLTRQFCKHRSLLKYIENLLLFLKIYFAPP